MRTKWLLCCKKKWRSCRILFRMIIRPLSKTHDWSSGSERGGEGVSVRENKLSFYSPLHVKSQVHFTKEERMNVLYKRAVIFSALTARILGSWTVFHLRYFPFNTEMKCAGCVHRSKRDLFLTRILWTLPLRDKSPSCTTNLTCLHCREIKRQELFPGHGNVGKEISLFFLCSLCSYGPLLLRKWLL